MSLPEKKIHMCDFTFITPTVAQVTEVGRVTNALTIIYNIRDEGSED